MRVLFLTKYYPPSEGGIERYSHLLCSGLARAGHEVTVVCYGEDSSQTRTETAEGVTIHRLRRRLTIARAPVSLSLPRILSRALDECDVLHMNFPNPWAELCYLRAPSDRPMVLSYHSDVLPRRFFRSLYAPIIKGVLRRATTIIAGSTPYMQSSHALTDHRERCRIIPYPVDMERLENPDNDGVRAARRRHGRFILFCGRLVHYKGVQHLIRALPRLQDLRLVVAGRGDQEGRYRAEAERSQVGHQVDFVGKVNDEQLTSLYHASECFVLPSTSRAESFGIVLAEAMACHRPVISTEIGTGTSWINEDGKTGIVVPPEDSDALGSAISRIVGDRSLQDRLGANAAAKARRCFAPSQAVSATEELYDELVAGGAAGALT